MRVEAISGDSTTGEIRLAYDLLYCRMSRLHHEDASAAALKLDTLLRALANSQLGRSLEIDKKPALYKAPTQR